MNYQCEDEYNAAMNAEGEAEAQMMQEYQEYLHSLIKEGKYQLHAIEVALDLLNDHSFVNSAKTAREYLIEIKTELMKPKVNKPLPF